MGVIDPVLQMDWNVAIRDRVMFETEVEQAVVVANQFSDDVERLMTELERFDDKTLHFLAMEVAREYADFHARKELH